MRATIPGIDAANISYNLLKTTAGNNVAIGPILLGGMAIWPIEQAREVMHECRALMDDAPEELSVQIVYTSAPELPLLDESVWGTPILALAFSWTGEIEAGERLLEKVRAAVGEKASSAGQENGALFQHRAASGWTPVSHFNFANIRPTSIRSPE